MNYITLSVVTGGVTQVGHSVYFTVLQNSWNLHTGSYNFILIKTLKIHMPFSVVFTRTDYSNFITFTPSAKMTNEQT